MKKSYVIDCSVAHRHFFFCLQL